MQINEEVLTAIAVCAELTGTTLSKAAAKVFADDLSEYSTPSVLAALERCRKELRGRMTVADVVSRITEQDGRPGADEAWAMCPMSEATTAVLTDEIMQALTVAQPLIESGDKVAARMAFKSAYERLLADARRSGAPAKWFPSIGSDKRGIEAPILAAVAAGRLGRSQAQQCLPHQGEARPEMRALAQSVVKRLDAPSTDGRKALAELRSKLTPKAGTEANREKAIA